MLPPTRGAVAAGAGGSRMLPTTLAVAAGAGGRVCSGGMPFRHMLLLVPGLVAVCLLAATRTDAAGALHGGEELARVYGAILDADFDRASHLLEDACPPAPN